MPFKIHCQILILLIALGAGDLLAQFQQARLGNSVDYVRPNIKRNNQSKIVWHNGYWWGAFREIIESEWYVYQYVDGTWVKHTFTGVTGSDAPDVYVDNGRHKLYLAYPEKSRFSRLTFSNGTWTLDSGFPIIVPFSVSDDEGPSIVRAADGDLFVFFAKSGALRAIHSSDDGDTWSAQDFIIRDNLGNSLTDGVAFQFAGIGYTGVIVGEGSLEKRFLFFRLADGDDPTISSNWIEESIPNSLEADNHVNLIRDADYNLYAMGKLGETGAAGQSFKIFRRSAASGNWSSANVVAATSGLNTRPALALDETNQRLYALATIGGIIQYADMDKNNMSDIAETDWQPALRNGGNEFNNVSVSYQQHSSGSNLMVAAENKGLGQLWCRVLDLDFVTDNVIVITEVKSAPAAVKNGGHGKNALVGAAYVELHNYSRATVSLSSYRLRYYNDSAATHTGSKRLDGTIPPLGYVVLAPDAAAFESAYGFAPDFVDTEFDLDGGADGVALLRSGTIVDAFNRVESEMISWNSGDLFQRANYPNSGKNLYMDYINLGDADGGSPQSENGFPVSKAPPAGRYEVQSQNDVAQGIGKPKAADSGSLVSFSSYPNPFNPETTIRLEVDKAAQVKIRLYDVTGQLVQTIFSGQLASGRHEYRWDGKNHQGDQAPSGIYVLQMIAGDFQQSAKLILTR